MTEQQQTQALESRPGAEGRQERTYHERRLVFFLLGLLGLLLLGLLGTGRLLLFARARVASRRGGRVVPPARAAGRRRGDGVEPSRVGVDHDPPPDHGVPVLAVGYARGGISVGDAGIAGDVARLLLVSAGGGIRRPLILRLFLFALLLTLTLPLLLLLLAAFRRRGLASCQFPRLLHLQHPLQPLQRHHDHGGLSQQYPQNTHAPLLDQDLDLPIASAAGGV
mmetsp:Transcript_5860/g.16907  ORF Transcript_5860/g.16907 Transcript_5860/m.16907 type:complete len:223 (-) Transcript_5860:1559-2227(-)